jgi:quercetin dioxygenase-like cupin family protein
MTVTDRVGTRVMFENDRARVWEQRLAPGERLESHAHHLPYFYIVIDGGEIQLGDGIWRSRPNEIGFYDIKPGDERVDPRLENVGTTTHRSFVVELKPEPPGGFDRSQVAAGAGLDGKTEPSNKVGTGLMFENDRVRIWDLRLAPGERLGKHIHRVDNFFIMISGGLIRFENPDDATDYRDVQFEDDKVTWVNVPPQGKVDNRLENVGTKPHRNLLIELVR